MKLSLSILLLAVVSSACSRESAHATELRAPNVILVCLDTVRADHLGCYGYARRPTTPNLDALAGEALLFEDASATAGWTKPSVPSFLTGTYPQQHGVYEGSARGAEGEVTDVLPERATTLAEVFTQRGYATAAFVQNAQLKRGNGFEQGFDTYVDQAGDAREIRWRAEDWLEQRDAVRPFFLYLHFLDAHWPYDVPDEYATKFSSREAIAPFRGGDSRALRDAINHGERKLSDAELEALVALYDGSLRSIDDELGRAFAYLARRGELDDTVVCVIADHGEEFMEHGRIGHGHGLYETLLRVPWILRVPGRAAERVATPVSLVDLFPTLLAAAGFDDAPASEGVDRLRERDVARPILAEHKEPGAYQQSLRRDREKLVRRFTPLAPTEPRSKTPAKIALGTRWEAELDVAEDGSVRARRLQARDEAGAEPLEIKARIDERDGTSIVLCGWRVRVASSTEFYGTLPASGAAAEALAPGVGVKAQCVFEGDLLVARRIKLYPAAEDFGREVRGTLSAFESERDAGRIELSGLAFEFDERTDWSLAGADTEDDRVTREAVAELLIDGEGARAAFRASAQLYDLASDLGETRPAAADATHALWRGLDALGVDLARRRTWASADRAALDERALDGLRELGYVR